MMNSIKITLVSILLALLFPVPGRAQRVEIYTDPVTGEKYAAINAEELPRNVVVRKDNMDYYVDANLYKYTLTGENSDPVLDELGNQVVVKRPQRYASDTNYPTSKRFIISPTDVYNDGTTTDGTIPGTDIQNSPTMNWATANGWLATANTTKPTETSSATAMGCPQYRGKNGTDEPGTWRTPTYREGVLMLIFREQIEATSAETGFVPFYQQVYYWLGTESGTAGTGAWLIRIRVPYESSINFDKAKKDYNTRLRCIRDVD
jgi:hypothetical protein